jgi:hypothetical protein
VLLYRTTIRPIACEWRAMGLAAELDEELPKPLLPIMELDAAMSVLEPAWVTTDLGKLEVMRPGQIVIEKIRDEYLKPRLAASPEQAPFSDQDFNAYAAYMLTSTYGMQRVADVSEAVARVRGMMQLQGQGVDGMASLMTPGMLRLERYGIGLRMMVGALHRMLPPEMQEAARD